MTMSTASLHYRISMLLSTNWLHVAIAWPLMLANDSWRRQLRELLPVSVAVPKPASTAGGSVYSGFQTRVCSPPPVQLAQQTVRTTDRTEKKESLLSSKALFHSLFVSSKPFRGYNWLPLSYLSNLVASILLSILWVSWSGCLWYTLMVVFIAGKGWMPCGVCLYWCCLSWVHCGKQQNIYLQLVAVPPLVKVILVQWSLSLCVVQPSKNLVIATMVWTCITV